jgi:hypothetical protein
VVMMAGSGLKSVKTKMVTIVHTNWHASTGQSRG